MRRRNHRSRPWSPRGRSRWLVRTEPTRRCHDGSAPGSPARRRSAHHELAVPDPRSPSPIQAPLARRVGCHVFLLRPDACSSQLAGCRLGFIRQSSSATAPTSSAPPHRVPRHPRADPRVLSCVPPGRARRLRFRRHRHGRPEIDPPCGLTFNLANHPTLNRVRHSPRRGARRRRRTAHPRRGGVVGLADMVFAAGRADCAGARSPSRRNPIVRSRYGPSRRHIKAPGWACPCRSTASVLVRRRAAADRVRAHDRRRAERWTFRIADLLDHSHRARARATRPDPVVRVHRVVRLGRLPSRPPARRLAVTIHGSGTVDRHSLLVGKQELSESCRSGCPKFLSLVCATIQGASASCSTMPAGPTWPPARRLRGPRRCATRDELVAIVAASESSASRSARTASASAPTRVTRSRSICSCRRQPPAMLFHARWKPDASIRARAWCAVSVTMSPVRRRRNGDQGRRRRGKPVVLTVREVIWGGRSRVLLLGQRCVARRPRAHPRFILFEGAFRAPEASRPGRELLRGASPGSRSRPSRRSRAGRYTQRAGRHRRDRRCDEPRGPARYSTPRRVAVAEQTLAAVEAAGTCERAAPDRRHRGGGRGRRRRAPFVHERGDPLRVAARATATTVEGPASPRSKRCSRLDARAGRTPGVPQLRIGEDPGAGFLGGAQAQEDRSRVRADCTRAC